MVDVERIRNYYRRRDVKFELMRQLKDRELAFIIPQWAKDKYPGLRNKNIRMLKCNSVQQLDYLFSRIGFFKHDIPPNIYSSVATYTGGIPDQDLSSLKRDPIKMDQWKLNHWKYMSGYDLFIDVDADDQEMFTNYSAIRVFTLLKETNTPFSMRFSGKGFHFVVPAHVLPVKLRLVPGSEFSAYQFCHDVAKWLRDHISCQIDTCIYDSRRLIKVPYSVAVYEDQAFVCCPLGSDFDVYNFKRNNYRLDNFGMRIRDRGAPMWNDADQNIHALLEVMNLESWLTTLDYEIAWKKEQGVDESGLY